MNVGGVLSYPIMTFIAILFFLLLTVPLEAQKEHKIFTVDIGKTAYLFGKDQFGKSQPIQIGDLGNGPREIIPVTVPNIRLSYSFLKKYLAIISFEQFSGSYSLNFPAEYRSGQEDIDLIQSRVFYATKLMGGMTLVNKSKFSLATQFGIIQRNSVNYGSGESTGEVWLDSYRGPSDLFTSPVYGYRQFDDWGATTELLFRYQITPFWSVAAKGEFSLLDAKPNTQYGIGLLSGFSF